MVSSVGNPQILHQKPITFFRQVLAICDYPEVGCGRVHIGYPVVDYEIETLVRVHPADIRQRRS